MGRGPLEPSDKGQGKTNSVRLFARKQERRSNERRSYEFGAGNETRIKFLTT